MDEEKRISGKSPASSWVIILIAVIAVGSALAGIFWPWLRDILGDKDRGAIVGALLAGSGLMISVWAAQQRSSYELRFTAQEERERRSLEDEKDRKLRLEQELKDRRQHSATQRIELSRKLTTAIPHIGDSNSLIQAAGIVELLFQIDDWYRLIESEIIGIMGMDRELEIRKNALTQESLRHRQELFDIAYKFDTENLHVLKSRAKGLTQRLRGDSSNSLAEVDFSDIVISDFGDGDFCFSADLRGVVASGIKLFNARMRMADLRNVILTNADFGEADLRGAKFRFATLESVDLRFANLQFADLRYVNLKYAILRKADLESAILRKTNLQFADLRSANLKSAILRKANIKSADFRFANLESVDLRGAFYDDKTLFPEYFDIEAHGMVRDVS